MRSSRSLRFFFCTIPSPSPSTSAFGLDLLSGRLQVGSDREIGDGENESLAEGMSSIGNGNRRVVVFDLMSYNPIRISMVIKYCHVSDAGLNAWSS